jgi:ankyrin repeat protein
MPVAGGKSQPNLTLPPTKPTPALNHSKSDTDIKKSAGQLAEELLKAVNTGKLVEVEKALQAGIAPDQSLNDAGDRAIHIAAREGYLPIVDRLIAHGAKVDVKNKAKDTPLHQALRYGQVSTSLTLISNNADYTIKDGENRVALHIAAKSSLFLPAQSLLDRGANANVKDKWGSTPLLRSVNPVDKNNKGIEINTRLITLLLEHGADPTIGTADAAWTPLHELADKGKAKELEIVAKAAKNLDVRIVDEKQPKISGSTALQLAVRKRSMDCVKVLIKAGAKVNTRTIKDGDVELTALWLALEKDTRMGTALLKAGADPNVRNALGDTFLHYATRNVWPGRMNILLEHKADINTKNKEGDTPIHLAARAGRIALVKLLIDKGAKVSLPGRHKGTPLMSAAQTGSVPIMQLLIAAGADYKYTTPAQTDAFIWACHMGQIVTASFLLGKGSDPNMKSRCNYQALHYAAAQGNKACVKWLLDLGVEKEGVATEVRKPFKIAGTAAQVARAHGQAETADLIDKYVSELDAAN